MAKQLSLSRFTDEEIEAQRKKGTCLRPYKQVVEPGLEVSSPDFYSINFSFSWGIPVPHHKVTCSGNTSWVPVFQPLSSSISCPPTPSSLPGESLLQKDSILADRIHQEVEVRLHSIGLLQQGTRDWWREECERSIAHHLIKEREWAWVECLWVCCLPANIIPWKVSPYYWKHTNCRILVTSGKGGRTGWGVGIKRTSRLFLTNHFWFFLM